jgi:hypothetical protein
MLVSKHLIRELSVLKKLLSYWRGILNPIQDKSLPIQFINGDKIKKQPHENLRLLT